MPCSCLIKVVFCHVHAKSKKFLPCLCQKQKIHAKLMLKGKFVHIHITSQEFMPKFMKMVKSMNFVHDVATSLSDNNEIGNRLSLLNATVFQPIQCFKLLRSRGF